VETKFWETWREFEIQHGNKDTFREMLRIKRSVAASFATGVQLPPDVENATRGKPLA